MVNIGFLSTGCKVTGVRGDLARIELTTCVCTSLGEKIALSRRVDKLEVDGLFSYLSVLIYITETFNPIDSSAGAKSERVLASCRESPRCRFASETE